jgi:hypothetical protein
MRNENFFCFFFYLMQINSMDMCLCTNQLNFKSVNLYNFFLLKKLIDCSCKWVHSIQMREMINFHQTCFNFLWIESVLKRSGSLELIVKLFTKVLQQIKQSNTRFWSWISIFFSVRLYFKSCFICDLVCGGIWCQEWKKSWKEFVGNSRDICEKCPQQRNKDS